MIDTATRIGPAEGDFTFNTRFLVESSEVTILEHVLPPRVLAGPVHRHTREDEFSYVLTGRVTFWFDGEELVAGPGDLVRKPRRQWHTFFNESDEEARALEIISPGGFEQLFRRFGATDGLGPEDYAAGAADFGCDLDFERTMPLLDRGLTFSS